MRLAYGPISLNGKDDWPLNNAPSLSREGFHIIPFEEEPPDDVDVICWHSPEYHPLTRQFFDHKAYKVGIVGDHHIVPFGQIPHVYRFDLIATDYRGTKRLAELGHPPDKTLYYRMFSWDRRLHVPPEHDRRDIAVSFLGRPVAERHPYLLRIVEWGKKTGHPVYVTTDPYERGKEAHYYQRSKLVWHMSQRGELSMRPYEAMACGALAMTELANDELYQANAPLVGWNDSLLEEQLTEWVTNDAAREAKVKAQWEWVQRETPARHLRYLCEQIRYRMVMAQVRPEWAAAGREAIKEMEKSGREEKVQAQRPQVAQGGVRSDDGGRGGRQSVSTVREGERLGVDYSQIDPPENERREEVCALVPMEAKTLLDLGCHQGGLLHHLRKTREGLYTVGVDLDPRSKERCVHRMDEFYSYDLEQYPFYEQQAWAHRQYDCIIAADFLEHVKDPWGVLGALRDLLAPGGCIVASIPNIRNTANLFHSVVLGEWKYHVHSKDEWRGPHDNVLSIDHIRFFTKESVERLFTDAGYVIEQWGASYLGAPQLEQWTQDLGALIGKYGGNVSDWGEQSHVIQFLIRARLPA